jgi:hypothetical protein
MAATVGEVISASAAAFNVSRRELLELLVRFVTPDVGGDSDPSRETILSYERASRTRCGYKVAGMVLDLLHAKNDRIKNSEELRRARAACRATLIEHRKTRYLQPPQTNAASTRRVPNIAGAYILFRRRASGNRSIRQELLILSHEGRSDAHTFATYITPELVCRGSWCVIQQNVCCMLHGFRGDYVRRDVVSLQMFYEEPAAARSPTLLSGFITGITSQGLRPVAIPLFAIRIADDTLKNLMTIGDGGDSELRSWWEVISEKSTPQIKMVQKNLDKSMVPERGVIVIDDATISTKVLSECNDIQDLLDDDLVEYCKSYSAGANWSPRLSPKEKAT